MERSSQALEHEWIRFRNVVADFVDSLPEHNSVTGGRPNYHTKDVLKALLLMAYRGTSYRRIHSELLDAEIQGLLRYIPSRPTLNRFLLNETYRPWLELLIR